ncbi:MAG: aminoglycoside phosphotransferase family protein [Bacteroidia bacterium]|nr:aminoglycoside phosphotransferase family protein [Bacteroidia bacterium]
MYIPECLMQLGQLSKFNRQWVDALPSTIDTICRKWNLDLGQPFEEQVTCSFVAPCRFDKHQAAILKIGLPHPEALHEIEGLQLLNGDPTVKILAIDKASNAMLLEKCIPGTHLAAEPPDVQDKVITSALKKIWSTPYDTQVFRPLKAMVQLWNEGTIANLNQFPDSDLAKEGCRIKEELAESNKDHVLLATDLHAGNVLSAQRQPWLIIDIKPYYGDRTYDLTQYLLNNKDRLAQNPHGTLSRLSDLANVEFERLQLWMFARLTSENEGHNQDLARRILND